MWLRHPRGGQRSASRAFGATVVAGTLALAELGAGAVAPPVSESAPRHVPARARPPGRRVVLLGYSAQGRPIRLVERHGPRRGASVLVVGCIHGNEAAGEGVTRRLADGPGPAAGIVWVINDANPDGRAIGARVNARGVDLNRNFPSQWRTIGRRGDPQYSGPRPMSEPETRLLGRTIERLRPDVTIWFHQPQGIVRAYGHSEPVAQEYAHVVRMRYRRIHWLSGTAPNWQNHHFRQAASFVVELAPGALATRAADLHARAVRQLASSLRSKRKARRAGAGPFLRGAATGRRPLRGGRISYSTQSPVHSCWALGSSCPFGPRSW